LPPDSLPGPAEAAPTARDAPPAAASGDAVTIVRSGSVAPSAAGSSERPVGGARIIRFDPNAR
jgi:hypothetical protein